MLHTSSLTVRSHCAWLAPFTLVLAACSGSPDTDDANVAQSGVEQAPLEANAPQDECTTDADCEANERCVLVRDGAPRQCVLPARASSYTTEDTGHHAARRITVNVSSRNHR